MVGDDGGGNAIGDGSNAGIHIVNSGDINVVNCTTRRRNPAPNERLASLPLALAEPSRPLANSQETQHGPYEPRNRHHHHDAGNRRIENAVHRGFDLFCIV